MILHSIHFAQYAYALPLTVISQAYNPPTPHFHYANIAYGTQFSNGLCYTHAVQPYLVQRPVKCHLLQSMVVF